MQKRKSTVVAAIQENGISDIYDQIRNRFDFVESNLLETSIKEISSATTKISEVVSLVATMPSKRLFLCVGL